MRDSPSDIDRNRRTDAPMEQGHHGRDRSRLVHLCCLTRLNAAELGAGALWCESDSRIEKTRSGVTHGQLDPLACTDGPGPRRIRA
jgi:hypothetical protein